MVDAVVPEAQSFDISEQRNRTSQNDTPLFLFFWLPAGKDAFGFKNWHNAPLNVLAQYRKGIYEPIGLRFSSRYRELINDDAFKQRFRFTDASPKEELGKASEFLHIADAKLGVRQITSNFEYSLSLEPDKPCINITGEFHLFSSGLYIWRFDISEKINATLFEDNENDNESIKKFIGEQFFKDVLSKLFDLNWHKFNAFEDENGHLVLSDQNNSSGREYKGVLNYHQLEILYNHIFSAETIPQLFFAQSTRSEGRVSIGDSELVAKYSLNNLLRSMSIISWGKSKRQYFLLCSERKDYSLRGRFESCDDAYFSPEDFINNITNSGNDLENSVLREHFYARLHFAAMEQFMRVANTFGLMPYREGLEAARKVVLLHNFRAKENLEPDQLYRESNIAEALSDGSEVVFEAVTCTQSYAEIYYELIKNKIPGLRLIQSLLHDISTAVSPLELDNPSSDESKSKLEISSLHEYYFSQKTFSEAKHQFNRQIEAIENEAEALRYLMERSGDRSILNELVETRKIHEITADDRIKVQIDPSQWSQFSNGLAIIAMGLTLALAVWQVGIWFIEQFISTDSAFGPVNRDVPPNYLYIVSTVIITVALVIGIVVAFFRYARPSISRPEVRPPTENQEFSTSIYDFANLRERVNARHIEEVFRQWKCELLNIFDLDAKNKLCRLHNVLSEMPTIGIEKRKYSFGSAVSELGEDYTLHVEIEQHLFSEESYWTDMRLAIRARPDNQDVEKEKERLIKYYVAMMLGYEEGDAKLKSLLWRHFGIRL